MKNKLSSKKSRKSAGRSPVARAKAGAAKGPVTFSNKTIGCDRAPAPSGSPAFVFAMRANDSRTIASNGHRRALRRPTEAILKLWECADRSVFGTTGHAWNARVDNERDARTAIAQLEALQTALAESKAQIDGCEASMLRQTEAFDAEHDRLEAKVAELETALALRSVLSEKE